MKIIDGFPKKLVVNDQITERKLEHYRQNREKGGGIKSSAFYAYLPKNLGAECEAICKERGYW